MALQKKCTRCKRAKVYADFGVNRRTSDGVHYSCKECVSIYSKTEKGKITVKKTKLKAKYGITYEQYQSMKTGQGGRCANSGCGEAATCIDHDHATGAIRAMLCNPCNLALGNLGESVDRINGLAAYIRAHGGK